MPFRTQFACLLAMLFAALVGVTAFQYFHPNKAQSESVEPSEELRSFGSDEVARHEYLSRFDGVVLARIEVRRHVVEDVISARLTLFEAAAKFKQLNSEPNPDPICVLRYFRGATDNERLCWQVITWIRSTTNDMPPSHRQHILDQLEGELFDHLARHSGQVILPQS